VEDGRDEVDDILRARITSLKLARERVHAALERGAEPNLKLGVND
jgi:hypothetical protein